MSSHPAAPLPSGSGDEFPPDLPVIADPELRSAATKVSVFSDDTWDVGPLAGKTTLQSLTIPFRSTPEEYRDTIKRIVWCTANLETPLDLLERPTATRTRVSVGTVQNVLAVGFRPFVIWLTEQGVHCLSDVDDQLLQEYAQHVASSGSRDRKGQRLFGVTRIWLLAPYLPEQDRLIQPPWERDGLDDLLGPANWSAENKTVPIHPQTMSPLLVWSIRVVEELADDILRASSEKARLKSRQGQLTGEVASNRVREYFRQAKEEGIALPGHRPRGRVAFARDFIASTLGVPTEAVPKQARGLTVELGTPLEIPIEGRIDGRPWRTHLHYHEVGDLRKMLYAACLVVAAYLSGMRGEEIRALERGCCQRDEDSDGFAGGYTIVARSFKDAIDSEGNTVRGGEVREQPWHVIEPVARAIQALEQLHEDDQLFPSDAVFEKSNSRGRVISDLAANNLIRNLIEQVNALAVELDRPHERIPDDPEGKVTIGRFRRTLAWFIYRRPGGRIALGVQYGHLHGFTSDGYGSRVSSGLRDVFPMEEAYARAELLNDAADRLADGEQVSGPAADRFVAGVSEFAENFQGQYLTPKQAAKLRRNPLLRIYDSGEQMVACCYDATKALCHPDNMRNPDVAATPDLTRCVPGCANGARTDTHVEHLKDEQAWNQQQADAETTPEPLRQRHRQRVSAIQETITEHEATRQAASPGDMTADKDTR